MSSIVFLIDNKEGHIIPSFKLAHSLRKRGHDIIYLSIVDNEQLVKSQGYRFYPLFSDIYTEGFNQANKMLMDNDHLDKMAKHLSKIMNGALDGFFAEVRPDLLVISVFLRMEAILLYYKYNIPPVIMTTYLRSTGMTFAEECMHIVLNLPGDTATEIVEFIMSIGIPFTSLRELLRPVSTFHELILCPKEFDMNPSSFPDDHVHHLGPSVFEKNVFGPLAQPAVVASGKKIIYASLGSYAVIYGKACSDFFENMVNIMREEEFADFHLILSVGHEFDVSVLKGIPDNVSLVKWAPQTDILKRASLVITHGGLGTIKESIFYGVPMIVFPMLYDQLRNAVLVDYHTLGISEEIEEISKDNLKSAILYVLNSEPIRAGIKKMRAIFQEKEDSSIGIELIEKLLSEKEGNLINV
ncbi:MAG TPA: glycosyltransferase [Puia sp.]|nr:glycosyltransferase [Puia sp.]